MSGIAGKAALIVQGHPNAAEKPIHGADGRPKLSRQPRLRHLVKLSGLTPGEICCQDTQWFETMADSQQQQHSQNRHHQKIWLHVAQSHLTCQFFVDVEIMSRQYDMLIGAHRNEKTPCMACQDCLRITEGFRPFRPLVGRLRGAKYQAWCITHLPYLEHELAWVGMALDVRQRHLIVLTLVGK